MHIIINRIVDYGSTSGTFGTLTFGDFKCCTVERSWENNTPRVSCIPTGYYYLERWNSPKFGESCIVYGGTVSKIPDGTHIRSRILIHPANSPSDLMGCIGLGKNQSIVNGKQIVTNSRKTVADFLARINIGETYSLKITFNGELANEIRI